MTLQVLPPSQTPNTVGLALRPGCPMHAALLASSPTSLDWSPESIHRGSGAIARPCWEVGLHLSWPFLEALKSGIWWRQQA